MGSCGESRCCKDISEFLQVPRQIDYKVGSNYKLKKGLYNDQILSTKYHEILNKIRESPSNYITESKQYNLSQIFIKLKPSNPIPFSEENLNNIISFFGDDIDVTIYEKESQISKILNNGYIKNICIYAIITKNDELDKNVWQLFEENEDDIEQILSVYYDYIIILCLPLINDKYKLVFIFYNEKKWYYKHVL